MHTHPEADWWLTYADCGRAATTCLAPRHLTSYSFSPRSPQQQSQATGSVCVLLIHQHLVSVCVSQNSCNNNSGPQSMAVWATAKTAAPSVADSPHTAIFIILFPFPHSWPLSRGKAASRPECRGATSTKQGEGGQTARSRGMEEVDLLTEIKNTKEM